MDLLLGSALGPDGALHWTRPGWQIVAVVAVAVVAWLVAAATSRSKPAQRAGELLCWAGALAVLAMAASGPVWVEEEGRTEDGRLVVLVDRSASMGVLEDGRPRSDAVARILDRLGSAADVYSFSDEVSAGAPTAFDGRGTDLGVALAVVADRHLGQKLQGIVVVTDGLDRGALRRDLRAVLESGGAEAGAHFDPPGLPGPLTLYQVGRSEVLHDLAVEDVVSGGFAFLRTPFKMTAAIRGPAGATVPVTLAREGRLVRKETITLDAEGRGSAAFEVVPTQVGRFAWEVSVPLEEGDAVPENNAFPVVIRVVRDRTRVLQVSGSPSYDQKFLRLFLKEDPSVDLISFFILRTHQDMSAGWRSGELSLIAFPYQELFSTDLETYDLVILQNFNYGPYFDFGANALLQNLADYVRNGGALVMTGGDRSFDLGLYQNTPIDKVLPLRLGVGGEKADEIRFRPELTSAGAVHPVTRLAGSAEESRAIWERLPEMDGLNLSLGPTEGSAVLLEHPTRRTASGAPMPVLAVSEVGAGRTLALAVDASWRWAFSEAAEGKGNQAYLRFWKNALRWLVADPDDRRVVVTPSRENVVLGDEVRAVVRVRDAGFGPVTAATVSGLVVTPSGSERAFESITDAAGEATFTFEATEQGAHRIVASAGTGAADRGETVVAVSARDPELTEIAADASFLQSLAALYGERGAYRAQGDLSAPLLDEDAARRVLDRKETPLDAAPLVALLFGLLASVGWWLRRRGGAR